MCVGVRVCSPRVFLRVLRVWFSGLDVLVHVFALFVALAVSSVVLAMV